MTNIEQIKAEAEAEIPELETALKVLGRVQGDLASRYHDLVVTAATGDPLWAKAQNEVGYGAEPDHLLSKALRSDPGKGDPVWVFIGGGSAAGFSDPMFTEDASGLVVSGSADLQEDFSTCIWPICVKVKPGTKVTAAAAVLRKMADHIEAMTADGAGFFDGDMNPPFFQSKANDRPY